MDFSLFPGSERTVAEFTLEQLCTSLTHALHAFLQGHTATIEAYVARAQTPTGRQPEAIHATLLQEIAHVAHFVETLQTDLTALREHLPPVDTRRRPPARRQPEVAGPSSRL